MSRENSHKTFTYFYVLLVFLLRLADYQSLASQMFNLPCSRPDPGIPVYHRWRIKHAHVCFDTMFPKATLPGTQKTVLILRKNEAEIGVCRSSRWYLGDTRPPPRQALGALQTLSSLWSAL